MVVLGFENFVNLPINPVNLDTLALCSCHSISHLEDSLRRNLGGSLSLEGQSNALEPL